MNTVIFAVDVVPLAVKLIAACLAGLLPGILSGRIRSHGKFIAAPYLIACVATTILLHNIVELDPGVFAIFGGLIIGFAVFLIAPSNKASIFTAISITLLATAAFGFIIFLKTPPSEMRHAISQIRQCGGVVQQSDNPGTTYFDQWSVDFADPGIDNDQLLAMASDLGKLPKLWLMLSNCSVGDQGIEGLANAENLVWLDLNGTQITDNGLQHLSKLNHLERLDLSNTQISDEGLSSLSKLSKLETLLLNKTAVTEDGVQQLQKLLHKCKIIHGEHH